MAKKFRYALLGCGGCGMYKHLAAYAMFPDEVELTGVYDSNRANAEKAAREFNVTRIYATVEEALADKTTDIVSVATPNAFHAPYTIAALKAGKHVHVEKPVALNAEEARAIVAAKNASGRFVMVGLNNRFTNSSRFAKAYVDGGHLGEIYHARCGWRRRRGIPGWGGWFTTKALSGGGPMIDLGVHMFDLTLYLMGYPAPVSVLATAENKFIQADPKLTGIDVEDFAAGFATFDTGASVAFEFSWASNIEQEVVYFELLGTQGGMRCSMKDFSRPEFTIFSEQCGVLTDMTPQVHNSSGWGENETRHFLECLRAKQPPSATPEEACTMMQIIDAIYASAQQRQPVALAPSLA